MYKIYFLFIMEWKNLLERFFYWVVEMWGGVILTILAIHKIKKNIL